MSGPIDRELAAYSGYADLVRAAVEVARAFAESSVECPARLRAFVGAEAAGPRVVASKPPAKASRGHLSAKECARCGDPTTDGVMVRQKPHAKGSEVRVSPAFARLDVMPPVTPWVRRVVIGCYAQTGTWPETFDLIARGAPVPADWSAEAARARLEYQRALKA